MKQKEPDYIPEYNYERLVRILNDSSQKAKAGKLDLCCSSNSVRAASSQ